MKISDLQRFKCGSLFSLIHSLTHFAVYIVPGDHIKKKKILLDLHFYTIYIEK